MVPRIISGRVSGLPDPRGDVLGTFSESFGKIEIGVFFSWFSFFVGCRILVGLAPPWIRIGFGPVWGRPVGIPRLYLGRQMEFGDKLSI